MRITQKYESSRMAVNSKLDFCPFLDDKRKILKKKAQRNSNKKVHVSGKTRVYFVQRQDEEEVVKEDK